MSSLSLSKIVFVLSVVSVMVTSSAAAPKPYELVDNICRQLGNEQFCLNVLKSDPRSKYAKDITTLTTIAVDMATKNISATRDYFVSVKNGPPALLKSLEGCIGSYNTVISELMNCLKEEDCSLISYDIHDAGDEVKRCQAMADSNGAHDSFITTSNNVTLDYCGLGESLANLMCNKNGD
ncbi:hypothetical protein M8C21_008829 [Ambrosia artemisiifolia]|uniref:Pectinesterase inhibitor domain-containing protein n=1 Tax=Ambrosia artemisiifolia TaxID=4212 RepID=A0AAD5DBX2_AMBAR|nr:hypothetical protein M8C21_008829 [Ambrosia artemisiifolia]